MTILDYWKAVDEDQNLPMDEMTKIKKSVVILGPNTVNGLYPDEGNDVPPRLDDEGNEFTTEAAQVTLWFRTWDEATNFVDEITDNKDETVINLTNEEWQYVTEILGDPPNPSPALIKLMKKWPVKT